MRTATFEEYAADAGFDTVEVLPIENFFWRFYRLYPDGSGSSNDGQTTGESP